MWCVASTSMANCAGAAPPAAAAILSSASAAASARALAGLAGSSADGCAMLDEGGMLLGAPDALPGAFNCLKPAYFNVF
jgi:hypothetical protein